MRSIRTVMRELTIKILNAGSVREDAEQNLSFKNILAETSIFIDRNVQHFGRKAKRS